MVPGTGTAPSRVIYSPSSTNQLTVDCLPAAQCCSSANCRDRQQPTSHFYHPPWALCIKRFRSEIPGRIKKQLKQTKNYQKCQNPDQKDSRGTPWQNGHFLTISSQQKIVNQKRLCRITTLINNIQSALCKSLSLLGLVIPSLRLTLPGHMSEIPEQFLHEFLIRRELSTNSTHGSGSAHGTFHDPGQYHQPRPPRAG